MKQEKCFFMSTNLSTCSRFVRGLIPKWRKAERSFEEMFSDFYCYDNGSFSLGKLHTIIDFAHKERQLYVWGCEWGCDISL